MATHEAIEHEAAVSRYPLEWPVGWKRTDPRRRQRAEFRQVRYSDNPEGRTKREVAVSAIGATQRLERQLELLGGQNPVLSTNVRLRLDGRPYSDQEPTDPGAACYFRFKGRATVLACDKWTRVADNIAALAQHIDALRRIERYGVGTIEQALAGYKALPADTAADWRAVFGFLPGSVPTKDQVDVAYKRAAREKHPDRGGSEEGMAHINRARDFAWQELEP
jgi:hypothetical protein